MSSAANLLEGHVNAFTPELDEQIVAGFWGDQKAMLRLLAEGGFSEEAVYMRAEEIGLFAGRSSKPSKYQGVQLVRKCLRCDQVFLAQGLYNRLCRRCRAKE